MKVYIVHIYYRENIHRQVGATVDFVHAPNTAFTEPGGVRREAHIMIIGGNLNTDGYSLKFTSTAMPFPVAGFLVSLIKNFLIVQFVLEFRCTFVFRLQQEPEMSHCWMSRHHEFEIKTTGFQGNYNFEFLLSKIFMGFGSFFHFKRS